MSYLDVPRLHFSGTFTANPSTINNDSANYNPALVNIGSTSPTSPGLALSWNPYGSHAWTISAQVTSFVDSSGQLHTSGDPLIGASFESYIPENSSVAKLVDLDTEQQNVTRLFGLNLQLTFAGDGGPALQGLWDNGGTLVNLWLNRVTNPKFQGSDSAAGGAFQSVLQSLQWNDITGSPFLQQLQDAAGMGLSVRLSVYGYQGDNTSSSFRIGSIVGTAGPQLADEPLHLPSRLLLPIQPSVTPQPMAWAPAKVNSKGNMVTIDLGNSFQDTNPGGPPVDPGTLQVAVGLGPNPAILGTIGSIAPGSSFQATAGVVQFPITEQQAGQPLVILINGTPQLAEPQNGLYIDVDGSSVYMNPGDQTPVNIWATKFGVPATGNQVPLALVPLLSSPPTVDYDQPANALSFPASVTIGANGSAPIPLEAISLFLPVTMPQGRWNIGGQLYYIGGPWAAGNVLSGDLSTPAPLTVKLFNSIDPIHLANPKWLLPSLPNPVLPPVPSVGNILYKYYYLYGFMASKVDLSNYDAVVANAKAIQGVLNLGFDDPSYMPVTREMSNDQRQLILNWITNGFPPGNNEIDTNSETLLASSPDAGSGGTPPEHPWSEG